MKIIHKLLVLAVALLVSTISASAQGKWTLPTYAANTTTNLNGGTSNDGTNWVSPYTFVTMTAAGTTAVSSGTNLVNQHVGYLRLNYVTNASNAVLTNLLVTYSRKPIRAGN